jgi:hypothetical protein
LKILPNDPDNIKKNKKIKIKSLKFAYKNKIEEEINLEKKNKWVEFNNLYAKNRFGKNRLDGGEYGEGENAKKRKY